MIGNSITLAVVCATASACGNVDSSRAATGQTRTIAAPAPDVTRPALPIPDDLALLQQLEDALDLSRREAFDLRLDAVDPGELIEHATITQQTIDRGVYGIDALFVFGDELFGYEFRPENGLGNGLRPHTTLAGVRAAPNMRVVHKGAFGGPDALSCASCHSKGGPDGAGTATQNAALAGDGVNMRGADIRNPPIVLGLGPIEALAREMTAELAAVVADAKTRAATDGAPVTVALISKGVAFGQVVVAPGGELDTSGVRGVDPDLVIKPFGWKGDRATIRAISEDSFRIHMGVVSMAVQERARAGTLTATERAIFGDGKWYDIDSDGVQLEIEAGMLTSMVAYLSQLEAPVMRPPSDSRHVEAFARGSAIFDDIGCAACHRRALVLRDPIIEVVPGQPSYADRPAIRIDVARDGEDPKITPIDGAESAFRVELFGDLARHDMGPELASPDTGTGVAPSVWLTRPLWGLADTAPYLHDGRAPTVHDAIRLHGGEARAARDAYLALDPAGRGALRVFLMSLTRAPKLHIP